MKSHVESDSNTLQFSYQDVFYEYLPYGVVLLLVFAAAGSFLGATYESHLPLVGGSESLLPASMQNRWYNFAGAGAGAAAGFIFYALIIILLRRLKNR